MASWTSETLEAVYIRLLEERVEFVVIGGQAVNLWSRHYSQHGDLPASEWQRFEPFSSRDLDCLGDSVFREYVRERLRIGVTKDVLLAAERVGRLACDRMGLNLWSQYSISCESYLPLDLVQQASDAEPKLASFISLRWPIIEAKIRDRRSRFLAIVEASEKAQGSPPEVDEPPIEESRP